MMKRLLGIVFAAAVFMIAQASPSSAQIFVIQTCGTVPAAMKTLVPGAPGMFFEDTTGTLCTAGGGGGGGSGAVFGPTAAGSAAANPPVLVGGTSDGTGTGTISPWKVGTGGIGFINCANCSGSGISVGFGTAIGSVGTPNGFKDASGNFQPILGDTTNGQWVSVRSVASGAVNAGAFAVGAVPNGGITAQGSTTDAPCTLPASATACSQVATEKAIANAANTTASNSANQATSALQTAGNTSLATIATNSAAPLPAQSNQTTNIGGVSGIVNVTPTDCSGTVTAGGTAQSPISASATIHGFTIANVDASAGSGEPLWISFTGTASAANGSYPLAPPAATTFAANGSYTTPVGFGTNHAVSIFAATTGHKFSCTTW